MAPEFGTGGAGGEVGVDELEAGVGQAVEDIEGLGDGGFVGADEGVVFGVEAGGGVGGEAAGGGGEAFGAFGAGDGGAGAVSGGVGVGERGAFLGAGGGGLGPGVASGAEGELGHEGDADRIHITNTLFLAFEAEADGGHGTGGGPRHADHGAGFVGAGGAEAERGRGVGVDLFGGGGGVGGQGSVGREAEAAAGFGAGVGGHGLFPLDHEFEGGEAGLEGESVGEAGAGGGDAGVERGEKLAGAGELALEEFGAGEGGVGFGEGGGGVGGEFVGHDGVVGLGHGEGGGCAVAVGGAFACFGEGLGKGDFPHGELLAAGGAADLRIHAFELGVGQAAGGGGAFLGGVGAGEGGLEGGCGGDGLGDRCFGGGGQRGAEQGGEKKSEAHVPGVTRGEGFPRRDSATGGLVGRGGGRLAGGMIYPGLVSITFRKLSPSEIVGLVRKAGLVGIEWGGDIHVPHGDVGVAREVRALTQEAGLKVAAYGSYYRAGWSEANGLPFKQVLDSAVELGAPTIRVWPGNKGSAEAGESERWAVIEDLRRISALAAQVGVTISTEFHGGTLTDTNESASQLLVEVDHANLFTCWQPHNGEETAECVAGLRAVLPKVGNVHVFHWWPTAAERHALADGAERWAGFWRELKGAPGDRFALLEFVRGDEPEAFLSDAATLGEWLRVTNR